MIVQIRHQQIGDTDKVWELLNASFDDNGRAARLAEALLDGPSRIALVAQDGDEIVGHVQLSRSWLDAPARLVDVLALSPLGVAPERWREGIARELVAVALAEAEGSGTPLVWLEGDPRVYPNLGFQRGGELGFRAPSHRIPAQAFFVRRLAEWSPWMTGGLVYPDVFWALDCVGPRRHSTD